MDQEWTVEQVSQEPPREWNNPKGGVIYYKKVMLKGHPRPVSVGKKSPDALHVGSTIYGRVMADMSNAEDKFKAGQNPNFGGGQQGSFGGSSSAASKPAYQPRDDDAIRAQWAIGQALQAIGNRPAIDKSSTIDYDKVQEVANRLFAMVEDVKKGSSESTDPKAQTNPTTSQSASNPARLKQGGPTWPSEHSDAEAESLYQSAAEAEFGGEDIPLDQIPF